MWIAPPRTRELRELARYGAKLTALRSGFKAQVHAVLAKEGGRALTGRGLWERQRGQAVATALREVSTIHDTNDDPVPAAMAASRRPVLQRTAGERERLSEVIADRLDGPMTALGIVFVLLVVAETVVRPQGAVGTAFAVASWVLWAAFIAEFLVRMVVAPSTSRFLRRNWWQLVFLLLPFLRFFRILSRIRLRAVTRVGRVVSSTVRGTRLAARKLTGRVGWLAAVTVIVVLASSQLLFEFADYDDYALALHDAAHATIVGDPLTAPGAVARVMEIVLSVYSVVVFAALAGMLGAYFLEVRTPGPDETAAPASEVTSDPPAAGRP